MNKIMNPSNREVRSLAISYILFGLVICIFNVDILSMIIRGFGVLITLLGAYLLYTFFIQRATSNASPLFIGAPSLLFGILMISSPESLLSMLPILVGIILIIHSIIHLQKSLILKDYDFPGWKINFISSLIILIGGIVLLLKPIQSLSFILQILGICLIVEAIFMLINQHALNKYD